MSYHSRSWLSPSSSMPFSTSCSCSTLAYGSPYTLALAGARLLTLRQFPWQTWILGLVKVFYDRELAISEHNVKLSSILHNSSLIMGRQIINILPEG